MNLKILFKIVSMTLKKNWIMVLSFFAFLLISLSILFGMIGFVIGFQQQLPHQVFDNNKYYVNYKTDDTKWSDFKDPINEWAQYSEQFEILLESQYKSITNTSLSDESLQSFIKAFVEQYNGKTLAFINYLNKPTNTRWKGEVKRLQYLANYMLDNWSNTNFVDYELYTNYLSKLNNRDDGTSITDYNWFYGDENAYEGNKSYYYLLQNINPFQKQILDDAQYKTNEYRQTPNVLFSSTYSQSKDHYKLGQKVLLTLDDGRSQTFIWGGEIKTPETSFLRGSQAENNKQYIIANYVAPKNDTEHKQDFRYYAGNESDLFQFWNPNFTGNKDQLLKYYLNIANDKWLSISDKTWFLNPRINGWSWTDIDVENQYIFFLAMLALTVVIVVIMTLLDIIIAWFLIKEIMRSMQQQLLFLKTLGMPNKQLGLINFCTLTFILGLAFCISLIGMLGIQAIFINLISQFANDWSIWSTIPSWSLIAIFGVLIFLALIYYISSLSSMKKLEQSVNTVVNKGEIRFKRTRSLLFNINPNFGITFSFTIKNLNKIIVTFLISLLIMTLSFTVLEFKESINAGKTNIHNNFFNASNFSLSSTPQYDKNNNKAINFKKGYQNSQEEITLQKIEDGTINSSSITNYFITRNDVNQIFDNLDKIKDIDIIKNILGINNINKAKEEWQNICNLYDSNTDVLWKNESKNFSINFGAIYENNSISQMSYNTIAWGRKQQLVIMNKSDPRYNKFFSDDNESLQTDSSGISTMPVVVGNYTLQNDSMDVNAESDPNVQINIPYENNDIKPINNLKLKIAKSTNDILDPYMMFVKEDDFLNFAKKQTNDIWNKAITDIKNFDDGSNSGNAYYSFGIPEVLKQIVIPRLNKDDSIEGYIETLKDELSTNNLNNLINVSIDYLDAETTQMTIQLSPLINALLILLLLTIILMISFIVFMVMAIMNENDSVIFVMKSLGYKNYAVLWRIIFGYLLIVPLSLIIGIAISVGLLQALNSVFMNIIFMNLSFVWAGSTIGLIFGFLIILSLIITSISAYKISNRSLTNRDDD